MTALVEVSTSAVSDTLFDVAAVHDLGRVKSILKTGLAQHTLWLATEVSLRNDKRVVYAVAEERNKHFLNSRTHVFMT